jgi:hypothetical protein
MGDDKLKVNIDLPFFKLDIDSNPDPKILEQVRWIMKEVMLQYDPIDIKLDNIPFKLDYQISEEFKASNLITFVKNAFTATDGCKYKKVTLPMQGLIDIEKGPSSSIDVKELDNCFKKLLFKISENKIDYVASHIIGNLSNDDYSLIVDQLRKRLPETQLRVANTPKDMLGKLVFEVLFFGEFPFEFDEQTMD